MVDIIAGIAGVLGFVLSFFLAVSAVFKNRESYQVEIIDYVVRNEHVTQFLVCFRNKSAAPLVVTEITYDGISCELEPKRIRGVEGKTGFQMTPQFPLCIPDHGAMYAYLEFVDYEIQHKSLNPGTTVTLEIRSTRHMVQKNSVLGDISHYLHTRAGCPAQRVQY